MEMVSKHWYLSYHFQNEIIKKNFIYLKKFHQKKKKKNSKTGKPKTKN